MGILTIHPLFLLPPFSPTTLSSTLLSLLPIKRLDNTRTPLQDTEAQQKKLDSLSATLNNPAGIIPNPDFSRTADFLQPTQRPPKKEVDPAMVEYNRKKQRRERQLRLTREPKYNYEPAEFYAPDSEKVNPVLAAETKQKMLEEQARKMEEKKSGKADQPAPQQELQTQQ
jgi:hypothetical protein